MRASFSTSSGILSRSLKVGTTTLNSGAGRVAATGAGASAGETVLIAVVIGEGGAHFNADGRFRRRMR